MLFPAVPAGPSDVRPPGPWPVAPATSVISRPLPACLTPSGLVLRAQGGGGVGGGLGRLRVTRPLGAPTSAEAGPQFLLRGLVGGENTQKCPPWAGWECWLSPSELPCEA